MKKDVIDQIIEDNQDLIKLQEEKADLQSKFCEFCDRDLEGFTEMKGEVLHPNEYYTMMSIATDYNGGVGGLSYTCYDCSEHMDKYHSPTVHCTFDKNCQLGRPKTKVTH